LNYARMQLKRRFMKCAFMGVDEWVPARYSLYGCNSEAGNRRGCRTGGRVTARLHFHVCSPATQHNMHRSAWHHSYPQPNALLFISLVSQPAGTWLWYPLYLPLFPPLSQRNTRNTISTTPCFCVPRISRPTTPYISLPLPMHFYRLVM
jgi:hypothetical protein